MEGEGEGGGVRLQLILRRQTGPNRPEYPAAGGHARTEQADAIVGSPKYCFPIRYAGVPIFGRQIRKSDSEVRRSCFSYEIYIYTHKRDRTRQDQTRPDKTRPDKTRHPTKKNTQASRHKTYRRQDKQRCTTSLKTKTSDNRGPDVKPETRQDKNKARGANALCVCHDTFSTAQRAKYTCQGLRT